MFTFLWELIVDNGGQVAFKNCAPFIKCITKTDGTTLDDAEDLDLVMSIYNLLEYSSNYSDTIGILWFSSKDEANNFNADIGNNVVFKCFVYKAKLLEVTVAQPAPNNNNGILKNVSIAVASKHLNFFWRSIEMLLINAKLKLKLKWANSVI